MNAANNTNSTTKLNATILPHCATTKKSFMGLVGKSTFACLPGCTKLEGTDVCIENKRVTDDCNSVVIDRNKEIPEKSCSAKNEACTFMGRTEKCVNKALTDEYKNKSAETPHISTFGGAKMTKTKEFVMIKNMKRLIYTGIRGGKYVKLNRAFVPLSKVKKTQQK